MFQTVQILNQQAINLNQEEPLHNEFWEDNSFQKVFEDSKLSLS